MDYAEMIAIWATAYRKAGWVVLPALKKRPVIQWVKWQNELPTLETVETWFRNAQPTTQIALVTGKISGVTVIDIDLHGNDCASKKEGTHECDCSPETPESVLRTLPFTLTSQTGSGGYHVFFQYEPRLSNSVKLLHPQMDIRNDGGIIILPPSNHHKLPTDYHWDEMTRFCTENLTNLSAFPPELLATLQEKPKTDWHAIVQGVGSGSRNSSAAALSGKLIRGFDTGDAWDLLWAWNQLKNDPPLPEKELKATFLSILKNESAKIYGEF